MLTHFPIFLDLHQRPPLVIGDDAGLAAKLRLLRKAAPIVEVIVSHAATWPDQFADDAAVRFDRRADLVHDHRKAGQDAFLHHAIKGRSLVILDTGDAALNWALVATARQHGVPVNVPDHPDLCSFYLASIVDRAPLVIAISTSGDAPVLGQVIRARLESMFAPHYGKLARYLKQLRPQLADFAPALRRQIQRQIITGAVAQAVLQDDTHGAARLLTKLLATRDDKAAGQIALIGYGDGDVMLLSLAAAEAIRGADIVFYDRQTPADILEIARREARLIETDPAGALADLAGDIAAAATPAQQVVWLGAGHCEAHQMLLVHLRALGMVAGYLPAARHALSDDPPVLLPNSAPLSPPLAQQAASIRKGQPVRKKTARAAVIKLSPSRNIQQLYDGDRA